MIHIKIGIKVNAILLQIDKQIKRGMNQGAKTVAKYIQNKAMVILDSKVKSHHGGTRLSDAILVKSADLGFKTIARYDVIVDTARAPYAMWIEFGRDTPIGLPYSTKGTKDYSKSRFKGYEYLTGALSAGEEIAIQIVAEEIRKSILKIGGK